MKDSVLNYDAKNFVLQQESKVGVGNFRGEGNADATLCGDTGEEVVFGGFNGTTVAAEKVEFPRGVEADGMETRPAGVGVVTAGGGAGSVEGWLERGAGLGEDSAGLADAFGGLEKVEVGIKRAGDEVGEDGVIEFFPPTGEVASVRGNSAGLPRSGGRGFRALVVGAEEAAGEEKKRTKKNANERLKA